MSFGGEEVILVQAQLQAVEEVASGLVSYALWRDGGGYCGSRVYKAIGTPFTDTLVSYRGEEVSIDVWELMRAAQGLPPQDRVKRGVAVREDVWGILKAAMGTDVIPSAL